MVARSLVATVAVLVLAAGAACSSDAESVDGDAGQSRPAAITADVIPPVETYEDCVRQAGFSPVSAQVLFDASGAPWHVKTSPEVPARYHGPCFEAIGGPETTGSSWDLATSCLPTSRISVGCAKQPPD